MQKNTYLQPGCTLMGHKLSYTIRSVLGQGSFGITYLATTRARISGELGDIETEVRVAIKEFFMHEFCSRHSDGSVTEMTEGSLVSGYARKFRKEAENLSKLSHPGIVKVLEVFEENNTCYYSMEYIEGGDLDSYVRKRGSLPEEEAVDCITRIADTLDYIHGHRMLHLDLKPLNVMRSPDGSRLTLIDFGLSKQYVSDGNPESTTSIGLGTPGYAPLEQSSENSDKVFSPTLDVYSLGATFFKLLTGETPPKASDVLNEGLPVDLLQAKGVSLTSINAIEKAMEPRKLKRAKSVGEFIALLTATPDELTKADELSASSSTMPMPVVVPAVTPAPSEVKKPKRLLNWLSGVVGGIALLAVAAVLLIPSRKRTVSSDINQVDSVAVVADAAPSDGVVAIGLESISLSKTALVLDEGGSATLTVRYNPSNATDRTSSWKSTNPAVAKVSASGKVTAIKAGNAAIIAYCSGREAYCNVTVKERAAVPAQSVNPAPRAETPVVVPDTPAASTTGSHNGHEWVDLGLSVKWATCNVGASSPSAYGNYFAWGEIEPKAVYTWATLKYCEDVTGDSFSKYNRDQGGTVDNKTVLDLGDDAARANWGGSWRMPTNAEFQELTSNCTWVWTSMNGKNGYKVKSRNNGNSIFLPANGYRYDSSVSSVGTDGYYWSSSLNDTNSNFARYVYFYSNNHLTNNNYRRHGHAVRPVLD